MSLGAKGRLERRESHNRKQQHTADTCIYRSPRDFSFDPLLQQSMASVPQWYVMAKGNCR